MKLRLLFFTSSLVRWAPAAGLERGFRRHALGFFRDHFTGPLHCHLQPLFLDRLEQIIERLPAKGFERILVVRGGENKMRQGNVGLAQLLNYSKTVQSWHLHIQKYDIRLEVFDQLDRFQPISSRGQQFHVGKFLQQIREFFARKLLVVDQYRRDCTCRAECHKMIV